MPTRRQHRLNELLFEELSLLVPGRLDDPRLAGAQVTRVETTRDMSTAKVYVTRAGDDATIEQVLSALDHAEGVLRTELSALGLRRLPHLVFAHDRDFESGERVRRLLDQLHDPQPHPLDDSDTDAAGG